MKDFISAALLLLLAGGGIVLLFLFMLLMPALLGALTGVLLDWVMPSMTAAAREAMGTDMETWQILAAFAVGASVIRSCLRGSVRVKQRKGRR